MNTAVSQQFDAAVTHLRAGLAVVLVDDTTGVCATGDVSLVMAAERITADAVAGMGGRTSGLLCVALEESRADRLGLVPMVGSRVERPLGDVFAVTVDARSDFPVVSAAGRAATIRALADPHTRRTDLSMPGCVFPLRTRPEGVLRVASRAEAAVDLCQIAGLEPVAVVAKLVDREGMLVGRDDADEVAAQLTLPAVRLTDLVRHLRRTTSLIRRWAQARLPTAYGAFTAIGYESTLDGVEHLALTFGSIRDAGRTLVAVHHECLKGDVFGSADCECRTLLAQSQQQIRDAGSGVLLYLRSPLPTGFRTGSCPDGGQSDRADVPYDVVAQILADLGVGLFDVTAGSALRPDRIEQLDL
ncbi:bifunctional 3,4-dihydroxy-2-butanone-4-phosphate synthase/GTP cyclohydrolase II [Gordonia sp. SID5947]|uniref:3,4-dihydroxy-2-butanone-4-phosphate synthase n=1 Tax=Gordonia sp. SID5947 TaxID=2690315 RepID=UPI00136D06EC|nr:3,4-dihydroxy-2-butanone-4-phosphate synthase [Gordonia sp. SID5947]MYR07964.1 bifunctional 3,4-dihydroxy-2-butanone-4-phosphate synthase/GTP cyclohydrolase II [Gordonia sp. SID5947]